MNAIYALIVPAALLFAAPNGPSKGEHCNKMQELDTDGSGTLSTAEVEGTRLADKFASIDANHDGELSKPEMKAARKARKGRKGKRGGGKHKQLDTDGNGSLSLSEVQGTRLADKFTEIDTNGDSELSRDEMKAARKAGGKGKR